MMWTTLDGYTLRLPAISMGKLRALLHQADLQDQIARYYRGDLGEASRTILGRLAQNARRVGNLPGGQVVFAAPLGRKKYRIVTRSPLTGPLGNRQRVIVSITRTGFNQPRTRMDQVERMGPADPKNDDPVDPDGYRGSRGVEIRTEHRVFTQHADRRGTTEDHHALPQFIGGAYEQVTLALDYDLHYLYHQALKLIEKLPTRPSYYAQLSPTQLRAVLKQLHAHAVKFDRQHQTTIAPALRKGIKDSPAIRLQLKGKIKEANAARREDAKKKARGRWAAREKAKKAKAAAAGAIKARTTRAATTPIKPTVIRRPARANHVFRRKRM